MSRPRDLTVLKLLAKGRTVTFTANACDLLPRQVVDIAAEHGALRLDGQIDPAAAAAAATRLQDTAGPTIPVREATEPVAPRQIPSPAAGRSSVRDDRPAPAPSTRPLPGYVLIGVGLIDSDGRNVRARTGDLDELAASIAQVGILQPITVTPAAGGRYVVELGHRRLAAARKAGLAEVPCIVRARKGTATTRVERLIENLHRAQLEPLEEAEAYRALLAEGLNQSEVARRVGVSSATVSTRLALLELPADAQAMLRDGRLPLTEAMRLGRQVRAKGAGRVHNKAPAQQDPWAVHPLVADVRERCDHAGRRRYGRAGCSACWEASIRADERARLATETPASTLRVVR